MKKIINEELKIYSCGIADLTLEQTKQFLELWNDGSTIGSLTVFYDNDGNIFLNSDNKDFEAYKEIILGYLNFTYERKEELKKSSKMTPFKEIFQVLDNVLKYREYLAEKKEEDEIWKPIKKMLGNQCIPNRNELDMIDRIYSYEHDVYLAKIKLYSYAFIQGKRAERARRKGAIA